MPGWLQCSPGHQAPAGAHGPERPPARPACRPPHGAPRARAARPLPRASRPARGRPLLPAAACNDSVVLQCKLMWPVLLYSCKVTPYTCKVRHPLWMQMCEVLYSTQALVCRSAGDDVASWVPSAAQDAHRYIQRLHLQDSIKRTARRPRRWRPRRAPGPAAHRPACPPTPARARRLPHHRPPAPPAHRARPSMRPRPPPPRCAPARVLGDQRHSASANMRQAC